MDNIAKFLLFGYLEFILTDKKPSDITDYDRGFAAGQKQTAQKVMEGLEQMGLRRD